jgi:hypothetical protein
MISAVAIRNRSTRDTSALPTTMIATDSSTSAE